MATGPLAESLGALSRFFVGDGTVDETLQRVVDLTVAAIPVADLVGITMVVDDRDRTAVCNDELALEIDRAQYDNDDGPCLSAFREQRITEIESTVDEGDWPAFRRSAAEHGIRSTVSFPLGVEGRPLGALDVYSRRERAFDASARDDGELFAAHASIVLANAQAYWAARRLGDGLGEAMRSRAVIEQAKGMLMAAEGIESDAAFAVLVRASQRENAKLRDIAQRIVNDAVERARLDAEGPAT